MLDAALSSTPGMVHLRFDRRRALFGRYDAIHFHWPETLLGGSSAHKRFVRRLYASALVGRLIATRVVIVRTVHNVEFPTGISRWERWILETIDRHAAFHITLNGQTPSRRGVPSALIPHGHFREWFADAEPVHAEEKSMGFVGLIRRYKGVEALMDAFHGTLETLPDWTLFVSGNPSPGLIEEMQDHARKDSRVTVDLRYLTEDDFARAVRTASGIVLPYRFMHNSGTALAALSLNRPVLVPRNEVNEALSIETGPAWVYMYDDTLTADDLETFSRALLEESRGGSPDLEDRGWQLTGSRHHRAYLDAVQARKIRA